VRRTLVGRVPRWRYAAAIVAGFVLVAAAPASAAGTWTLEAGETRTVLTLSAVSCTSAGWCAAVGSELDQSGAPSKVYAESGSGTTWTVAPSSGPKPSVLTGVSCVAPDWCQAVGFIPGTSEMLVNERWDGQAWSQLAGPVRRGSLMGVSCVSRSFCMAVGGQAGQDPFSGTLAERWNGKKWSVVATPNKGSGPELDAVACVSPTWCAAVGSYGFSYDSDRRTGSRTLAELWNG
jgi:hypothetical protein